MVNSLTPARTSRTDPDERCGWSGTPPATWCTDATPPAPPGPAEPSDGADASREARAALCLHVESRDHDFDDCVLDTIGNGVLFHRQAGDADAIDARDVSQGQVADCFVFACLAALSQTPDGRDLLRRAIVENKGADGNVTGWTVTLHQRETHFTGATFRDVQVTVDSAFVVGHGAARRASADKGSPQEVWPLVLEKALAKYLGGYETLNRGGDPAAVMALLVGREATSVSLDWPDRWVQGYGARELASDLAAGKFVVLISRADLAAVPDAPVHPGASAPAHGLFADHAYFVIGVEEHDGRQLVRVGNPWGFGQPEAVPCAELARWFSHVSVASLR